MGAVNLLPQSTNGFGPNKFGGSYTYEKYYAEFSVRRCIFNTQRCPCGTYNHKELHRQIHYSKTTRHRRFNYERNNHDRSGTQ